jgi:hypothetical protein
MGEAGNRLKRFLEDNPECCFCGGGRPATTEDHQPGRVFFRNREWPEGFSFPACQPCNALSRDSENLVSLIACDSAEGTDRLKYQSRVASIRSNFPDVVPSLLDISTRDKRRAMHRMHLSPPQGTTYAQLPMVKLDLEIWRPHLDLIGQKIMLALHYQTFRKPLSRGGRLWLAVMTNGADFEQEWFKVIRDMTGRYVLPTRSKRNLLDQLTIQWDFMRDPRVGMYLVTLQKSLVFIGLTSEAPNLHEFPELGAVFGPLGY